MGLLTDIANYFYSSIFFNKKRVSKFGNPFAWKSMNHFVEIFRGIGYR